MSKGHLVITEEFYAAIGHALTSWGCVESSLCSLFCACVGPPNGFPTRHAFWAVISFEAKLGMVEAVMDPSFPSDSDIAKCWTTLHNRLSRKNRIRNKIAHGSVVNFELKAPQGKTIETFFAPYFWGTLGTSRFSDTDFRPKDRMYLPDIKNATTTFNDLVEQIDRLARDVYASMQLPAVQKREAEPKG